MTKRTSKALSPKKLEALIDSIYNANCSGVEIDIMDIGKIFKVGEAAYSTAFASDPDPVSVHTAVRTAIVNFVNQIRKN